MRIFSSPKFEVIIDKFKLPNGKEVDKAYVKHRGSVVILPFINKETIVMIKQYRPIINKWLYELPAGTINEGETEEETAKRELEEETGYQARSLTKLFSFYVSPGITTEVMHVIIAKELVKTSQRLEEYEIIEPFEIKLKDAIEMVLDGKIEDGKTMLTLLFVSEKYQELLAHKII